MHWILSVSPAFSLTDMLHNSHWLLHPPFSASPSLELLHRVERLNTGHTIALTISQTQAGLVIRSNERLTGSETEEVSHKVWRMLRLNEDLQAFWEYAQHIPALATFAHNGGRLLRGADFFEDVIKSMLLTWKTPAWGAEQIHWLVDRFGDPLPTNPTRHAFPTAQQFLWNEHLLREMPAPALALRLIKVAEAFHLQGDRVQATLALDLPAVELAARLMLLLALDERALDFVMLSLGRYEHIPTADAPAPLDEIRQTFPAWSRWGGLICWLWHNMAQAQPSLRLPSEV